MESPHEGTAPFCADVSREPQDGLRISFQSEATALESRARIVPGLGNSAS